MSEHQIALFANVPRPTYFKAKFELFTGPAGIIRSTTNRSTTNAPAAHATLTHQGALTRSSRMLSLRRVIGFFHLVLSSLPPNLCRSEAFWKSILGGLSQRPVLYSGA